MQYQTFVRRNRSHWCLSQEELARLLGISQSAASRLEAGEIKPDFEVAVALQVVFARAPRALFPGVYHAIEEEVMQRAALFSLNLEGKEDHISVRKKRLLASMIARSANARQPV